MTSTTFTFAAKLSANPMIGRRVLYMLHKGDADEINRARATIRKGLGTVSEYDPKQEAENSVRTAEWQAEAARREVPRALSTGNGAEEGQILPAFIVTQWTGSANLQVFLDGNDTYWATSRSMYRGDNAPEFKPDLWYYTGGRWHFTVDGEEVDQKAYVEAVADVEARPEDPTRSWEPDARGMWVFAD